jgi:hypothetical protein
MSRLSSQSTDLCLSQGRSPSDGDDMDSLEVISEKKGANVKARDGQAGTALHHYRDLRADAPTGEDDEHELTDIRGVTAGIADELRTRGLGNSRALRGVDQEILESVPGVSKPLPARIKAAVAQEGGGE